MKKLLLVALLFTLSITAFAQDTFVKKYTSYISESKGVLQPWVNLEVTVVFNANNTNDVVFYYPSGKKRTLHQISDITEGKTENNTGYQAINCIDEDGIEVMLQLFDGSKCLRILISKGYYIEFHK
jgi:hypothetical protein